MKIKAITDHLESIAPLALQESYDNAGLLTGDANAEVTKILVTLDVTEAVVQEAIDKGCNLIVAHHPIIFKGLKSLTGRDHVERTVILAIKNDIAIYATHTNLDSVKRGVNAKLGERLGLQNLEILAKAGELKKLEFFVPTKDFEAVAQAVSEAGAGNIGEYKECNFRSLGTGRFRPEGSADPAIGKIGKLEEVEEYKVEAVFPAHAEHKILKALLRAHPYEEVAYFIHQTNNKDQDTGAGMVGNLPEALPLNVFLQHLKTSLDLKCIRHTADIGRLIKRVAICGGAGSFLLGKAISAGADAFVTGDFKYHEFFGAEGRTVIADVGHYESEVATKELLITILSEKFRNIAVLLAAVNTNPINYF